MKLFFFISNLQPWHERGLTDENAFALVKSVDTLSSILAWSFSLVPISRSHRKQPAWPKTPRRRCRYRQTGLAFALERV